jgi:hypothetical protein
MSKLLNRAKMTTATTGTGTITLGSASPGFQTFVAAGALNGDILRYVIEDGTAWEIGNGTYTTAGTTLTRTLVESSTGSLLNLSGSATVYSASTKEDFETLDFPALAAEPSVPPTGRGLLYAREIAGRVVPKWIGPSGVDYPLQPHIGLNNAAVWRGGNGTTQTTFAAVVGAMSYSATVAGSATIPALDSTSLRNQTLRSTLTTNTTAGNVVFCRVTTPRIWRGNAAGLGGFFVSTRFALSGTLRTGLRCFVGVSNAAAVLNQDPVTGLTSGHNVGLAINSNTGNWNLVHNGNSSPTTAIPLGANFPVNNTDLYEIAVFCAPNSSSIGYRVVNWSTNQQTSGTLTTNIPTNTAFMGPIFWITNNAQTQSQAIDFISTYVETDY